MLKINEIEPVNINLYTIHELIKYFIENLRWSYSTLKIETDAL